MPESFTASSTAHITCEQRVSGSTIFGGSHYEYGGGVIVCNVGVYRKQYRLFHMKICS